MTKPTIADVLFGNADIEDVEDKSEIYEVYDTLTELLEKRFGFSKVEDVPKTKETTVH